MTLEDTEPLTTGEKAITNVYGETLLGTYTEVEHQYGQPATMTGYDNLALSMAPRSFWPLDEASGDLADLAGGYDITPAGGTWQYAQTPGPFLPGSAAGYSGFDAGGSGAADGEFGTDVYHFDGRRDFTWAGWLRDDGETVASRIVSALGSGDGYYFYLGASGALRWLRRASSTDTFCDYSLSDDDWHHVLMTYNGSTLRLYVDGVEEDSAADANESTADTSVTFRIGSSTGNYGLKSWGVWDRVLDDDEIADLVATRGETPDEPTGEAGVAFSGGIQTVTYTGINNGDFLLGPPDPSRPLGPDNELPYWRWVGAPGVAAFWESDTNAPAGHRVTIYASEGVADGSEFWLEQVIPVSPTDPVKVGRAVWGTSMLLGTHYNEALKMQALDAFGRVTGTEESGRSLLNYTTQDADTGQTCLLSLPADARFLRVRVGADIGGGDLATDMYQYIHTVSAGLPRLSLVTIAGGATSLPASGSATIWLGDATLANAARYFVPSGICWVQSVSAILSGSLSLTVSQTLDVKVRNVDAATALTPVAGIPTGNDRAWAREPYALSAVAGEGDNLSLRMSVTGGTLSSTSLDIMAHAQLAVLLPDVWDDFV